MKKRLLRLTMLLLFASFSVYAQTTVTGKVTSAADGSAVPGVSILVKGTTTGTTTDAEGKYTISVPAGSTALVASFIGFATQEVSIGNSTIVDIVLVEDITELGEVVVTALGIAKETKTLGYSVTEVDGALLTKAREINVANSLVGRVAGVSVGGVSGGPGSSSNVTIRGVNTLASAGTPPMYVINGVPIDNQTRGSSGQWGGADLGDGIANINPDDIEDMTVLKGSTAAALYGSRAAGGVIVITTKSGKNQKGLGIEINSNYVAEKVWQMTDFQDVYGQGANGVKPTTAAEAAQLGGSWGGILDGSNVPQFDGQSRPYVAQKDNYDKFYRTGSTFTNTLSLSNGFDKGSYRFSASRMAANAIVPNSGVDRNTFNLSLNYKIAPKLILDIMSNYVYDKGNNRSVTSDSPGNANFGVTFLPTSYDVTNFNPGYNPVTGAETLVNTNNIYYTNPYFASNRFRNGTKRNRSINVLSLKYNVLDWLSVMGRFGYDRSADRQTVVTPTGTGYRPGGDITENSGTQYEMNSDFLVTADRKLTESLDLTVNVGGNIRSTGYENQNSTGAIFSIPYLYVLDNTVNRQTSYRYWKAETRSLYYNVELGYKDMLFLSTTGRQDWFSTLDGRAIFYPSVGASFVFSELMDSQVLNFGKVRASWAKTTSDPTYLYYQTALYYNLSGSANGFPLGQISNSAIPNPNLGPNSLREVEVGVDLKFFDSRFGIDFAYYNRLSTNEPVNVTTSITTGYTAATLNVGSLENKGIELLLTGTPVKTTNFTWDISFNYTNNQNKVLSLAAGLDQITLSQSRSLNAYVSNVKGLPVSQIMAFDYKRNDAGQIIYDANGFPISSELKAFGSGYSPIYGGVNNEFRFKGFNLSFLVDFKSGGKIFSATDYYAYIFGLHKNTLVGREEGIIGDGVTEGGAPNQVSVPAQEYYAGGTGTANRISSQFVYDASFIKLRQVIVGFDFPTSIIGKTPFKGVNLSFVARNLAFLKKNTDNIDPEANLTNTAAQGLELAGVPPTRTYGFNLNLKF